MKKKFVFVIATFSTALLFSCKKEKGDAPVIVDSPGYRVKTENGNWGTSNYTYDGYGRQTLRSNTDGSRVEYEYGNGFVHEKTFNTNNVNTQIYMFEIDANGLATKETRKTDPSLYVLRYFNGDRQLSKMIYHDASGDQTIDYFYSNGNCDSVRFYTAGTWSSSILKTYYTDKENSLGYAVYGRSFLGKSSRNLIKSETYTYPGGVTGSVFTYSYEFDSNGRAVKETDTYNGQVNQSIAYIYQ